VYRVQTPYTKAGETVAATLLADREVAGAPRIQLLVYDQGRGESRVLDVPDGAEVTFGRSRTCTIAIESEKVSRTHAKIRRDGDRITVEDLGSRNGTAINGTIITEPRDLASGDSVAVGPVLAVLSAARPLQRRPILGSASYLDERLAAECDRGSRYNRQLALIMLRLEGDEPSVDTVVGQLARKTRPMDVLAEYSPDEIAFLFPEADRDIAATNVQQLIDVASDAGVSAWAGAAVFPADATDPGSLIGAVRSALREARRGGAGSTSISPGAETAPEAIVIEDAKMVRVYELVDKVADSNLTVLITGETGSGKEVIAEALHKRSRRAAKPYIRINCACLTETLLESELFGHERGSFTGADRRKIGYFEACNGGTLLLDEIGEMPMSLQSKLLRVLEEHRFNRVGGTAEIEVDVRVLCATNRDLAHEVKEGRFREDLFFRVSAFTLAIPPLRDRQAEILPLARAFLRLCAGDLGLATPSLSESAAAAIQSYPWPGNVRELRNAMERAVVLGGSTVEVEHLPDRLGEPQVFSVDAPASITIAPSDIRETIADVEKQSIVKALESEGGNQTRAAKRLGISRRSLIYKMEKHGLKAPPGAAR